MSPAPKPVVKPAELIIAPATSDMQALPTPEKSPVVVAQSVPGIGDFGAIREPSQGPTAMEARFTCENCQTSTIVRMPWDATALHRQIKMKEALDLHRLICTVGLPEEMRIYRIHYPR